jgi:hemerythrin
MVHLWKGEFFMPGIDWNEDFLLNVVEIDQHHEHLVKLFNSMYEEFTRNAPPETLGPVLHDLVDYATYHFLTEERYMEEARYPALKDHKDDHKSFILKVTRLKKLFERGDRGLSFETVVFLKNWISNHILSADVAFGKFLAERNDGALPGK